MPEMIDLGQMDSDIAEESTREDRKKKEYRFELRKMAIDNSRGRLKGALKKARR